MLLANYQDIGVDKAANFVGTIEIQRPPHNFLDMELIEQIATAMEGFDKDDGVRAVVLCAQGKSFCAGANFNDPIAKARRLTAVSVASRSVIYISKPSVCYALKSQSCRRCMALQ